MIGFDGGRSGIVDAFLTFLTRRTSTAWTRYGFVVVTLAFVTLFRVFVPLDTAPFLLYLPVVFLLAVAFGKRAGYFATVLSAAAAATFFDHPGLHWWQFTFRQWIALVEYLLVSTAMVNVCGALRGVIYKHEASLAQLQASETNLRTILDTVPVGILFAEAPSGRIIGRNKKMDDIVGTSAGPSKTLPDYGNWQAYHADGRRVEAAEYPLARVIRDGANEAFLQIHYQRRDGSRVWLDLIATAARDTLGLLTGAVVAVSDIDARKKAETAQARLTQELNQRTEEAEAAKDAAEAANKAKSAFLANMSHELRTPLSAVIGYTELLEEEAQDVGEPGMLTDLGKIKSNAKHLLSLINDVLDLSKVEASKMEVFSEPIVVQSFVRDVVDTMDTLVRQKANILTLDLTDDLGTMYSDAVKLRQCLFNLLGNACKFTDNGKIVLRVRREPRAGGDWLSFDVEDTGIGMSPDQLRRLFQRFTQADESTTRKFGGTGLGLALSRAFSKLLGGDITVQSTEGKGTCFTLLVPAAAPQPAQDAALLVDLDETYASSSQDLVLVIDDEASQRELLTRFLEKQDFAVRTAADGRSGLELARTLKPRAILLDVMMPDTDGWSVLKALKADAHTADIPVVMVSFVAEPRLSASLGAADSITKPIDWAKLKTVLNKIREAGGDVLVVDDDADTRTRLRIGLERNGWTVQEAGDGAEALERVLHAPPHLILLDLTMPVMDGFAFLHQLRATPGCSTIPVVILSARDITAAERARLTKANRIYKKGETSVRDLAAGLRELHGTS